MQNLKKMVPSKDSHLLHVGRTPLNGKFLVCSVLKIDLQNSQITHLRLVFTYIAAHKVTPKHWGNWSFWVAKTCNSGLFKFLYSWEIAKWLTVVKCPGFCATLYFTEARSLSGQQRTHKFCVYPCYSLLPVHRILIVKDEVGYAATSKGPKPEAWNANSGMGFLLGGQMFSYIFEAPDGMSWN